MGRWAEIVALTVTEGLGGVVVVHCQYALGLETALPSPLHASTLLGTFAPVTDTLSVRSAFCSLMTDLFDGLIQLYQIGPKYFTNHFVGLRLSVISRNFFTYLVLFDYYSTVIF